jgi:hypothetical protein
MPETGTSGLMSGDGKRGVASPTAPALVLDSTIVPHEDEDACELDQTEEVGLVIFPTGDQAAKRPSNSKRRLWPSQAVAVAPRGNLC